MSWLITDYPFYPAAIGVQRGRIASVPADGSAAIPVIFDVPFSTIPTAITGGIITSNPGAWNLSGPQFDAVTTGGMTITVTGGPPGSTVSVSWEALL